MLTLLQQLQKRLVMMIPLVMVSGFLVGYNTDATLLKRLILPLTFLMVYPMMINLPLKKVFEPGDFKLQLTTQLLNFGVIPFLAFGLGRLFFPGEPALALGLLLASLLPTSGMTISWTGMAHGNIPSAVKMTVIGLLAGSFLTPLYVHLLMGALLKIPLVKIFSQIVLIVLLPLVLGNLTQRLLIRRYGSAKYQKDIKSIFPLFSTLGVLGVVFVALALKAQTIAEQPGLLLKLLLPLILLYGVNFIVSTLIGKLFFCRGDAIALVYGTVMRNLSIALAIAMTAFGKDGSQIALILAMAYIIQVQSAAWYVKFTDRLFGKPEPEKARDAMLEGVFALHVDDTLEQAIRLLAEEQIHSVLVLNGQEQPLGMISAENVIDALADNLETDTRLATLPLSPVVLVTAEVPLQAVMSNMKRTHAYKAVILDAKGKISHVLTTEELLLHFTAASPSARPQKP